MKVSKKKRWPGGVLTILIAMVLLVATCLWLFLKQSVENYSSEISTLAVLTPPADKPTGTSSGTITIPLQDTWSERLFNLGVAVQKTQSAPNTFLVGGILPHHQVGSQYIADLLSRIDPKTTRIIWLVPDHFHLTEQAAFTTPVSWLTPFGVVKADMDVLDSLPSEPKIKMITDTRVAQEHALSGMVPYIAYYLPQAQLVPLAFNPNALQKDLDVIVTQLQPWVSESTVVIASVDFSHDLPQVVADERDKVTWQAISTEDWETLFLLNDEYLDSPAAVYVVSQLVKNRTSSAPQLFNNNHSSVVLNELDKPGTSYLEMGWEKSQTTR